MSGRQILVTPAATVQMKRQRFLDAERILPRGVITSFVGRGGEGKTAFALDIVARITTGTLEGELFGRAGNVLIIAPEDDKATQLVPRLKAAGADLNRVAFIEGSVTESDGFTFSDSPTLGVDLPQIADALTEWGATLLMVDPVTATMTGDPNKSQDVRRELARLDALAKRLDIAVLSILHVRKGKGGDLADRASGSHAFRDVVRSSVQFATDHETGRHIATLEKTNYSGNSGKSWAFSLESATVEGDNETLETIRVQHHGESMVSVADLMADPGDRSTNQSAAETMLRTMLEPGSPVAYRDIVAAARVEGLSESAVKRAAEHVGVIKDRSGFGGGSHWQLAT
ncbi:MAG TPA: AAA family ATPase [Microbacteriaceae bacterium]|nr:AAA family ATPase [Microbacteriaceae bacterium]